jgi:4-hydroxy-tetrahydrodipicolinate synthase
MIRGVLPILQTPFGEDGALDIESLRREVDYVCAAGVPGMAFPGFASEWWKLSQEEILACARVIRAESKNKAQLVLNVTAQSTHLAVEQARAFQQIGCDWLMVLPPFVGGPSSEDVIAHLRAVLAAVPLPHILQYSASLTGVKLSGEQILEMRSHFPHFCSIKVDFIPPGPMVSNLRALLGEDDFTYLIGYSGLQLPDAMRRGAHGLMGGAGHAPEDLAVFRALKEDLEGRGMDAFRKLLPLLNMEMQTVDTSVAVQKRLLMDRGVIASDHVRAPGKRLDRFQAEELRIHLAHLS